VSETQDIRQLVIWALRMGGYAGLANEDCGCVLADLMPCDEPGLDCHAAFAVHCDKCPEADECDGPHEGWSVCDRNPEDASHD
jgi:hypothetical protein